MADSIDLLLSRYRELAAVHAGMNYSDRSSVRRGNAAADSMRELATRVAGLGANAVATFGILLSEGEPVARWAAHHLLELMHPPEPLRTSALSAIERRARDTDAEAAGERMWLEQYYRRQASTVQPKNEPAA